MSAEPAVFYQRRTIMARHVGYGLVLLAILVALVRFRATVAAEFAPSLARLPGLSTTTAAVAIEWAMVGLLAVTGPLFVLSMGYLVVRMVDRSPALVVDRDGFTDDASLANLGRIRWDDVAGVQLVDQMGVPQLRVDFTHPEDTLDGYGGLTGAYLRFNRRSITGDGAIPLHQLDADVETVVAAFETHGDLDLDR